MRARVGRFASDLPAGEPRTENFLAYPAFSNLLSDYHCDFD
jgi:hypothetical protein